MRGRDRHLQRSVAQVLRTQDFILGMAWIRYTIFNNSTRVNPFLQDINFLIIKCIEFFPIIYEFKLKKMLQTFQVNSQGLTSDTWNLKFPLLKNIVVEVPEYEEQEKVGIFFKKLDNLITLHQEKINQLTKLKTTFLKNMFI